MGVFQMKQMNHGKMMHSITAIALVLLLAVMTVFPGGAWGADGVYAADEDTESSSDEAAAVSDEESDAGNVYTEEENVKVGEAFGTTVGEVEGLSGDFILTYTFYDKSNGTDAWDNFVVEVRSEDYYWFDLRADNYGWLYSPTAGYSTGSESITYGNGASDWDVWTTLMQRGQDCTVYIIRQDTTVTIVTQSAGDTFYAYATIDHYADGTPLYAHLTGESCTLESVTYSIEYVSDWSSKESWLEELLALADENDEGGVTAGSGATLDGTELESTEWWTNVTGVEVSSDSSYATWNYTILVESSVSDFGIEVYNEDGSKYITTLTNGEGWYYGDLEANDLVIAGDAVSDSLERGKLFYVTVVRTGDDFTIYYMDSSQDILLMFFATDTNMDENAFVHFYAEYGSFVVAAEVSTDTAIESDGSDEDSEDTETDNSGDSETDDTEDEDSEDVEEDPDDGSDDDDDDYDIEDLDSEEVEDTETEEEDTSIVVTLDETVYTSDTWWSGAYGSEAAWTGDAVWVYFVAVDETYGDDAFSVQIYDDDGNTITFSSDGTSQYDGVSGDAIEVSGDPIVVEAGAEYTVTVHREGTDLWAIFYDADGNELLSYYAGNTDLADTAAGHFYAQIGTYTVNAESSGTEAAGVTALLLAAADSDGTDGTNEAQSGGSDSESGSNQKSSSSGTSTSASAAKTGDVPVWEILLIALLGVGCIVGTSVLRRSRR